MIFDQLKNLNRYSQIPYLKEIQDFLSTLKTFPKEQEIEILERELFVRTGEYETGPAAEKQFEAHTIYADLQLMIAGEEVMEISLESNPKPVTSYQEEADIRFFANPEEISPVHVPAGHFTVFFPGELHKPGCQVNGRSGKIQKLVFKIKMPGSGTGSVSKFAGSANY
jgi:YhcH/YjgK/YiaL family protein